MKILVTGANGYIGFRLIPGLVEEGHDVIALVRSKKRFHLPTHLQDHVQVIEGDLLNGESLDSIPDEIDAAYYLVHSMTHWDKPFEDLEQQCARNFVSRLKQTQVQHVIYLSGLVNDENLSQHLESRLTVEEIIKESGLHYTVLRAGIIIGSGSASFEIMRDLVELLPIMVAPKWVTNRCQPIGIYDVLSYLREVLKVPECRNQVYDIGGPEQLAYKEMLEEFAEFRGLKRYIITVPVLTPRLSSYWLYFVTSTSFPLAMSLVDSLKCEAICKETRIQEVIPRKCQTFKEALNLAFSKIEQNAVLSSWKDALVGSNLKPILNEYMTVPTQGCVTDIRKVEFQGNKEQVIEKLWRIGGENGWYFWDWSWRLRGFVDKVVGGVGLRRGRTHPDQLSQGNALDFWRVLHADKENGKLLLYAEMKLPGEAWLEFYIEENVLIQKATFRPKGIMGRLYWYGLLPIHKIIFQGMANRIAQR